MATVLAGLSWSGVDSAETLWVGLESFVFDWLINADRYSGLHDVVSGFVMTVAILQCCVVIHAKRFSLPGTFTSLIYGLMFMRVSLSRLHLLVLLF